METFRTKDLELALDELFVSVPSGTIEMRDDRTQEKWNVKIDSFHLARYPVTQSLYEMVTHENPSTFKGERFPVETISWIEAVQFCNSLSVLTGKTKCYLIDLPHEQIILDSKANGFRLPTEAEWQYACQAGTSDIRYGAIENIAWFKGNSGNQPHTVGQKQANPWGFYDMLGNLWEWCTDIYDETVYGSYRIFRGGGWCDQERSVMATTRRRSHPYSFKIDDLGFRLSINSTKQ